jgi:hypothetical protein
VRLTTLIARLHRVRIIGIYVPVRIRHFFAALRKHFCNPRSAPPDFTGDISYMVNRDKYDAVMAQALFDNARGILNLPFVPGKDK